MDSTQSASRHAGAAAGAGADQAAAGQHLAGGRAPRFDLVNTTTLAVIHVLGLVGIWWVAFSGHFHWQTLVLAAVWYVMCGFAITGGYHRLFSHKAYQAHPVLKFVHLFFGAASVQNSALKWSSDHRVHHAHSDTERDPYSVTKGFWWAHVGWVLAASGEADLSNVKDLEKDRLVRWQHRFYVPLAFIAGAVVPALLGFLWGDVIGALLFVGCTRLMVQWHATFAVNSFAHLIGSRPYDADSTARDSWIVALMTFGEGYHNYHHKFPSDYRNGVRWWQFDPTKWVVWSLSKVGITSDLRRTKNAERYKLATALRRAQEAAALAAHNASAKASEAAANAASAAKAATAKPSTGASL